MFDILKALLGFAVLVSALLGIMAIGVRWVAPWLRFARPWLYRIVFGK